VRPPLAVRRQKANACSNNAAIKLYLIITMRYAVFLNSEFGTEAAIQRLLCYLMTGLICPDIPCCARCAGYMYGVH